MLWTKALLALVRRRELIIAWAIVPDNGIMFGSILGAFPFILSGLFAASKIDKGWIYWNMHCSGCGSIHLQKLSLVYMSGFRDFNTRTVGWGRSLYIGRTRGTSQSRLSQIAAPPQPRRYLRVLILWLLAGYFGAVIISSFMASVSAPRVVPIVDGHAVQPAGTQEKPIVQSKASRRRAHVQYSVQAQTSPANQTMRSDNVWNDTLAGTLAGGYILLLFFLLRRVWLYNRTAYAKAMQKWNASFMCQRCGNIVDGSLQQTA